LVVIIALINIDDGIERHANLSVLLKLSIRCDLKGIKKSWPSATRFLRLFLEEKRWNLGSECFNITQSGL